MIFSGRLELMTPGVFYSFAQKSIIFSVTDKSQLKILGGKE